MDHSVPISDVAAAPVPAPAFDASAPVPQEYDAFCENCGYSLLGLSGDRCPECGRQYDPLALPFARIPWLHRRRIGRWSAYWQTVRQATFRPQHFAVELCRPVRISADDARRFRRISIHIGAFTGVALATALIVMADGWIRPVGIRGPALLVIRGGLVFIAWVWAVWFFRLSTDMPLFIWKGLPSLPPSELAPLHHYASAPLALLPFVAPALLIPALLASMGGDPFDLYVPLAFAGGGVLVAWLYFCWRTPLAMMKCATGCGARRVALLALYLPVHCLLMALFVFLLIAVAVMLLGGLLKNLM
jgi:hypothetical protein